MLAKQGVLVNPATRDLAAFMPKLLSKEEQGIFKAVVDVTARA